MSGLGLLDWTIFGGYLVVVFALGVALARGQRDNEEFFVGGRRMNWAAVGVSLFATAFSSLSFVALPAAAAFSDYHLLVTYLAIALVITPLLWWLFVPVYLRLRVTSVYEYLEIRFDRRMRKLGTILFALYAIGWMGSMVYATGLIIQAVLGLDEAGLRWTLVAVGAFATLYTALGGIRAVVWTDVLQAMTLGGGMLVVLVMAIQRVDGGLGAVVRIGLEHGKFEMFDFRLDMTETNTFFAAMSLALFAYLPGYTTSQITVQRYLCMPGLAQARRSLLINAVVATLVAGLFFFVGSTLFAFYTQTGGGGLPHLAKNDQILPYFVLHELRTAGLTGLLIAGLFAAVMSTIDSGINSLSAVMVYDWLAGRDLPVALSRLLCALFGVAVIAAALVAPWLGENVIDIISKIAGAFLGLLFGVFLMGLLVPRANTGGALVGLVAGSASLACAWTQTDISGWWFGAYTCLPTFGVGCLASYLFPPPRPEQLAGLFFQK
jgi:SSS family transporter